MASGSVGMIVPRATVIFLGAAIAVFGAGSLARGVLGLGCLGPVLPAWGCLAAPYPDTLPSGAAPFYWTSIALGGWLLCFALRNPVWLLLGLALRRLFPSQLARIEATREQPRGWNIR